MQPYTDSTLYTLKFPEGKRLSLMRFWLILAITALAGSGIYSILPVLFRSPGLQEYIPFKDFFHTTIVIHVDLSVLIWMLSISCMLWTMLGKQRFSGIYLTTVILAAFGTLAIGISPFIHEAIPLMNNYIPVLQSPVFFIGLALFGCAILMQVMLVLTNYSPTHQLQKECSSLHFGLFYAVIITAIALLAFVLSYVQIMASPNLASFDIKYFYELLFWGGGHTLQFTYAHMMVIAWLWLASANGYQLPLKEHHINFLLSLNVMLVIPSIVVYFVHPADSAENIDFFTQQMRYGGGLTAGIVGIATLYALATQTRSLLCSRPEFSALLVSIILFGTGGIIGFLISGYNVTIPAHYHGSIVGITLAFMGLVYHFLPRLGFGTVKGKLATIQPYIYGGGQLLHIIGLGVSGGYGVLRKTPGVAPTPEAQLWMAFIVIGGMFAILGGLIFVIVALRAVFSKNTA